MILMDVFLHFFPFILTSLMHSRLLVIVKHGVLLVKQNTRLFTEAFRQKIVIDVLERYTEKSRQICCISQAKNQYLSPIPLEDKPPFV